LTHVVGAELGVERSVELDVVLSGGRHEVVVHVYKHGHLDVVRPDVVQARLDGASLEPRIVGHDEVVLRLVPVYEYSSLKQSFAPGEHASSSCELP